MRCTVLLFAHLRESLATDRLDIDVPTGATVADALDHLAQRHPPIADMRGKLAVAVDEQYQPTTAKLTNGCTIALIPPVSGG
ncbi:MAG: molybdopterin converting factor subunit 1 [Phycisphaerales bacterium]|nr:molybdopterin converting factor subunit 1 [Phycisphaerales bacterium]MCI0629455.1 molybdopterin converting factor subunit 1 [Phycisphaerales bacterium]MCI0677234.1 molybdopterin converting factor subunit 1 [Phycisphaerales bacterium]